ncbi:MAG: hypothetical protein RL557_1013 [archaeon]|jgi:uncharacterized protein (UPF0332 family)
MNFEKLLREEKIERVEKKEFSSDSVENSLLFARKGLESGHYDEVLSIVYNSIFRICNTFMNYLGYRAIGKEHHKNLFEFLFQTGLDTELVSYFDIIRKKRNDFIYRNVEIISKEESEEMILRAQEFVQEIRTFVQKKRTWRK